MVSAVRFTEENYGLMTKTTRKVFLLLLIVGAIAAVRLSGVDRYLTFQQLQESKAGLERFVHGHYGVSVLGFILSYIIVTGLSLPGAAVMTLAGGFLFGMTAVLFVNVGATAGACLAFLASRYLIGEWVQKKYGGKLDSFNRELTKNGHLYLLGLRLIPAIPFFLINIFSGLTAIGLPTFFWTTAVGIIPGSLVYVYAGTQLASLRSLGDVLSTNMIIAFVLLGLLALLPAAVKYLKKEKW